jgi:HK97 family phage prohead protease
MSYRSGASAPVVQIRAINVSVTDSNLPDGVCGQVRGVAVRYDVIDSYGTIFRRGCFDKTRAKVRKGLVKLFDNHGMGDFYGTDTHIGVVRSLEVVGDGEEMVADLFDTEAGRRRKEYLSAVQKSGAQTGLSVGFFERAGGWEKQDGKQTYSFTEVELDEISLAPRQAVPGSLVTDVRSVSRETREMLARQASKGLTRAQWIELSLSIIQAEEEDEEEGDDESLGSRNTAGGDEPQLVTDDERMAAYRRSFIIK